MQVLQFDALCLCLQCEALDRLTTVRPVTAYAAASEWLLAVSVELLRPDPPADHWSGLNGPDQLFAAAVGKTRVGCWPPFEQRFRYFSSRVSKARLWSDDGGDLFRRLQAAVEGYMGEMAGLCHARYEEMLLEAEGGALVALPSYPEGDDGEQGAETWDRRMRQDGDEVIPRRLDPSVKRVAEIDCCRPPVRHGCTLKTRAGNCIHEVMKGHRRAPAAAAGACHHGVAGGIAGGRRRAGLPASASTARRGGFPRPGGVRASSPCLIVREMLLAGVLKSDCAHLKRLCVCNRTDSVPTII